MPIKFNRVDPAPQPLPPPTYSITGLSKQEAIWLRALILDRKISEAQWGESQEKQDFFRRLQALIITA